jgi:hypothetical protein
MVGKDSAIGEPAWVLRGVVEWIMNLPKKKVPR